MAGELVLRKKEQWSKDPVYNWKLNHIISSLPNTFGAREASDSFAAEIGRELKEARFATNPDKYLPKLLEWKPAAGQQSAIIEQIKAAVPLSGEGNGYSFSSDDDGSSGNEWTEDDLAVKSQIQYRGDYSELSGEYLPGDSESELAQFYLEHMDEENSPEEDDALTNSWVVVDESSIEEGDKVQKKTTSDLKSEIQKLTFDQEIERDKESSLTYLNSEKLFEGDDPAGLHKKGIEIFKRMLLVLASCDLQVYTGVKVNEDGQVTCAKKKPAHENQLPIVSYVSHGARVVWTIPPSSEDKFINWLLSGDATKKVLNHHKDQGIAMEYGFTCYSRDAATHGVAPAIGQNAPVEMIETKDFWIGVEDAMRAKLGKFLEKWGFGEPGRWSETAHYGVNLQMGLSAEGFDMYGNKAKPNDDNHGHLYIRYAAPTQDKEGCILIGIEKSAPSSNEHSLTGASDPFTHVQTSLWEALDKKKENDTILIGDKYNGRRAVLSKEYVSDITRINWEEFFKGAHVNKFLSNLIPQTSLEDFAASCGIKNIWSFAQDSDDDNLGDDDVALEDIEALVRKYDEECKNNSSASEIENGYTSSYIKGFWNNLYGYFRPVGGSNGSVENCAFEENMMDKESDFCTGPLNEIKANS